MRWDVDAIAIALQREEEREEFVRRLSIEIRSTHFQVAERAFSPEIQWDLVAGATCRAAEMCVCVCNDVSRCAKLSACQSVAARACTCAWIGAFQRQTQNEEFAATMQKGQQALIWEQGQWA